MPQPLNPDLVTEFPLEAPTGGLLEGLDSTLSDGAYPPEFSPDIENVRVVGGQWLTRPGTALERSIGGFGDVRFMDNLYQVDGRRTRLAAQGTGTGGTLYEYKEGTDAAYVASTGGGTLGGTAQPYFQMTTIGDLGFLTDRNGALKKYTRTGNSVGVLSTVASPTAPAAAPRVRPRAYAVLETWSAAGIAAWSMSNNAKYDIAAVASSTVVPPGGGNVVNVRLVTADSSGQTITRNVTGEATLSHTIAWWVNQHFNKLQNQFGIGILGPDEFVQPIKADAREDWYPVFMPIGDVPAINYKRFKCVANTSAPPNSMYVGPIILPGRLEGEYRWVYTYYNPTTLAESEPSAVSGSGVPSDFSVIGVTNQASTARAFQKSAALDFTHGSQTGSGVTKIRVYRNGGVDSLTKDSRGRDVYYRVGEIFDQTTTLNGGLSAGGATVTVTSATNLAIGDLWVLDKGTVGTEEYVVVTALAGAVASVTGQGIDGGLLYNHSNGASVALAFLDNVANELIDVTQPVDMERDDPPSASRFIQRSPEGRLWIFNYSGKPTGVAVSNRSTPDRPYDYQIFPDGVDPLTRRAVNQGWRFQVGGDTTDEEIVWGGFFQGTATILTKRHLYLVMAHSQVDWGPLAVPKELNVGCIAGDTVAEVNGVLYWVTDGPKVVRWAGRGQAPEILSHLRVNERLQAAPTAYWINWFARYHVQQKGSCYDLYYTPSGATTNTERLVYNADANTWEPERFYNSAGTAIAWRQAAVRDGGSDTRDLYQIDTGGAIVQTETGITDQSQAIRVRVKTKKIPMSHGGTGMVSLMHQLFIRCAAVTDTVTVTVAVGGSEYGDVSHDYTVSLAGTGDVEHKIRLHRDLLGRWCQITLTGSFVNRPAIRQMVLWAQAIRAGAIQT